jgi:hypothetical protein
MTSTNRAQAAIWRAVRRAARWVAEAVADCNYVERRLAQLRLHPDWYAFNGDRAPATYDEFLFRISGPPWQEPSADERAAGAPVHPVASRHASKRGARR